METGFFSGGGCSSYIKCVCPIPDSIDRTQSCGLTGRTRVVDAEREAVVNNGVLVPGAKSVLHCPRQITYVRGICLIGTIMLRPSLLPTTGMRFTSGASLDGSTVA